MEFRCSRPFYFDGSIGIWESAFGSRRQESAAGSGRARAGNKATPGPAGGGEWRLIFSTNPFIIRI